MFSFPDYLSALLSSYNFIFLILLLVIVHLAIEAFTHWRNLRSIPIRIHINGSSGKSSVTRLIAAGLREHGMIVCAKTSGTLPCFIRPDGTEQAVYRSSGNDMLELVKIVKTAASFKPQVLVFSCSATIPELQALTELKLVKSTHGVITNILEERLDIMGPTRADVALAFAGTIPVKGKLYTPEHYHLGIIRNAARDRGSKIVRIKPAAITAIDENIMQSFSYTELTDHPEKIATALRICQDLGVSQVVALQGMWKAAPDPEIVTVQRLQWQTQQIIFVNAFAVNNAEEATKLWPELLAKFPQAKQHVILFNCRADRAERSEEFATTISNWSAVDKIFVLGSGHKAFIDRLSEQRYQLAFDWEPIDILNKLAEPATQPDEPILVVGMGNISGIGFKVFEYFTHVKHIKID